MGCDIHAHVEVKIDGQWKHWSNLNIRRCYELFAKMANVRNYEYDDERVEPIAEPRGLPLDMTDLTAMDANRWGCDGHSHSWLSGSEMKVVQKWIGELYPKCSDFWAVFGYVGGNYPWDYECEDCKIHPGWTDSRVVFWFDN
jgi:hypothetical protein